MADSQTTRRVGGARPLAEYIGFALAGAVATWSVVLGALASSFDSDAWLPGILKPKVDFLHVYAGVLSLILLLPACFPPGSLRHEVGLAEVRNAERLGIEVPSHPPWWEDLHDSWLRLSIWERGSWTAAVVFALSIPAFGGSDPLTLLTLGLLSFCMLLLLVWLALEIPRRRRTHQFVGQIWDAVEEFPREGNRIAREIAELEATRAEIETLITRRRRELSRLETGKGSTLKFAVRDAIADELNAREEEARANDRSPRRRLLKWTSALTTLVLVPIALHYSGLA
jgi:hypothetical protein